MVQLIYIVGFGRSGSTLIESKIVDAFNGCGLGEVFFIWERGVINNDLTADGKPFRESDFWRRVFSGRKMSTSETIAAKVNMKTVADFRGNRISDFFNKTASASSVNKLATNISPLYQRALAETSSSFLIDSSKYPRYGRAIADTTDLSVGFLHIYRDPRAVVHSWQRVKARRESTGNGKMTMARSRTIFGPIWRWISFNEEALKLRERDTSKYIAMSYEEFCNDPESALALIQNTFDIPLRPREKRSEWYSVSGNPARFDGNLVDIKVDDQWEGSMHALKKIFILAITFFTYNKLKSASKKSNAT